MNSVANGKIREQTAFRDVFIQPASGDNGTALGAAFYAWHAARRAAARASSWSTATGGRRSTTRRLRRRSTRSARRFAPRGCSDARWDDEADARRVDGGADRRRPRRRLVSGADGMGRARARQPQHRRRPAARRHARHHQHAHQVPRALPAVRAVGRSRKRSTTTSSAPCPIRSCCRSIRSGRTSARSCRRSRTSTARAGCRRSAARSNPRYWNADQGVRARHRRADAAEHVVQRERTDRAAPAGGARLLPADAHGRAGHGTPRRRASPLVD